MYSSSSCTCNMPCPPHPYLITWIIFSEEYQSWSSLLCSVLKLPITSPSLAQIYLTTQFLNTLSLCASFIVRGRVSCLNETTGWIRVLYISIFMLLDSNLNTKDVGPVVADTIWTKLVRETSAQEGRSYFSEWYQSVTSGPILTKTIFPSVCYILWETFSNLSAVHL